MSNESGHETGLGAIIDLAVQLDRDRGKPVAELRRRDREIGRRLASLRDTPRRQVLAWLSSVSDPEHTRFGPHLVRAQRIGALFLGLAGLILGWLAAAAVFYYDGSQPVNIINVLVVFVAVQLGLVLLLLITFIPVPVLRLLPGAGSVVEILELLSPGRLQKLASRFLPTEYRRRAESLLGASRAHRVLFGRAERWLVTFSSQFFAVAFNAGALLSCLYLILFSDIAFSWSTTLQVTSEDVHSLTRLLAAPWSGLVSDASPSFSLIEASRYFRLKESLSFPEGSASAGPAVLGGWWPFLVMSMLCYGLLPRILFWGFSGWRLRRSVHQTILHLPGIADLLDRMNRELVETRSGEAESPVESPRAGPGDRSIADLGGKSCALINWEEIPIPEEELSRIAGHTCGCAPAEVSAAGGASSLARDAEVIGNVAVSGSGGGVIVFVKAWEPPLKDLHDFLIALRNALPGAVPVVIIPVGVGDGTVPIPPDEIQLDTWRASIRSLGDPWLSVRKPEWEV